MRSKNKDLLDEFVAYCNRNPDMRFWQALVSWSGTGYILTTNQLPDMKNNDSSTENYRMHDTFYWEEKDK